MARRTQPVASITSAPTSPGDDLAMRTRRYLWTMGIRTACFVAAIFVPGWPRWVLIAGAVLLPYLGVVGANAGRERIKAATLEPVTPTFVALPAGSSRDTEAGSTTSGRSTPTGAGVS
jgi:hypothetical protein